MSGTADTSAENVLSCDGTMKLSESNAAQYTRSYFVTSVFASRHLRTHLHHIR